MKIKFGILLIAILALAQGCIPSLHPLWSEDTLVYKPELNGSWLDNESVEDDKVIWEFSGGFDEEGNRADSYRLIHTELKAKAEFEVHLVKLGKTLFFDFFPDELQTMSFDGKTVDLLAYNINSKNPPDINLNSLYFQHMLPIHTFAKVEIEADEVRIYRFDPDYIDKLFKERRVRIQHEKTVDGQTVLTAPTSDLQKFFEKYANDEKAFVDPIVLRRKSE